MKCLNYSSHINCTRVKSYNFLFIAKMSKISIKPLKKITIIRIGNTISFSYSFPGPNQGQFLNLFYNTLCMICDWLKPLSYIFYGYAAELIRIRILQGKR